MPYFAHVKLKDIKSNHYEDALKDLKKQYAPSTVDGIYRTGRMIFKKAIQKELIKNDPTQFIVLQKKTIDQLKDRIFQSIWKKKSSLCF